MWAEGEYQQNPFWGPRRPLRVRPFSAISDFYFHFSFSPNTKNMYSAQYRSKLFLFGESDQFGGELGIQGVRSECITFITQVEQPKLNSCSMSYLSKTSQVLCHRHFNFSFSKDMQQFSKRSNSRTKNSGDIKFSPKCGKYNVVFLVKKKIEAYMVRFVKYDEFNV